MARAEAEAPPDLPESEWRPIVDPKSAATTTANDATTTNAPATEASTAPTTGPVVGPTSQPVFDVTAAGAIPDGKTIATAAIQKAIDQCAAAGGGVVTLPPGSYLSGALYLKSHVTLRLEDGALLKGSENNADYPTIETRIAGLEMPHPAALINAIDCENVALVGAGMIDGSGKNGGIYSGEPASNAGAALIFKSPGQGLSALRAARMSALPGCIWLTLPSGRCTFSTAHK